METMVIFDINPIVEQINKLVNLLRIQFPEGIPHNLISEIRKLSSDVVLGDCVVTSGADGTQKIIQSIYLGSSFEKFASTFGAN